MCTERMKRHFAYVTSLKSEKKTCITPNKKLLICVMKNKNRILLIFLNIKINAINQNILMISKFIFLVIVCYYINEITYFHFYITYFLHLLKI